MHVVGLSRKTTSLLLRSILWRSHQKHLWRQNDFSLLWVFALLNLSLSRHPPLPPPPGLPPPGSFVSRLSPQRFIVAPPTPFCSAHLSEKPTIPANSAWREFNASAVCFYSPMRRRRKTVTKKTAVSEFGLKSFPWNGFVVSCELRTVRSPDVSDLSPEWGKDCRHINAHIYILLWKQM